MPTYDFICLNCGQKFSLYFSFAEYGKKKPICPFCKSEKTQRRISRIRIAKSGDSALEDIEDDASLDRLEDDPKAMGKILRRMRSEAGEDAGPEMDEVIGRLESGQSPEDIEKNMPELGGSDDAAGGEMPTTDFSGDE